MPELLHVISAACPDIVVLDWELPGAACANRVEAIRAVAPEAKVIVTSVRPEAAQIEAIRADGLINKSDPPEVILGLFRAVMNRHV
jgi:DNA-binding NarL/FixJ family response regulator